MQAEQPQEHLFSIIENYNRKQVHSAVFRYNGEDDEEERNAVFSTAKWRLECRANLTS